MGLSFFCSILTGIGLQKGEVWGGVVLTFSAMPSLPSKLIFPSWVLLNVRSRDEYLTDLTPARGAEVTTKVWSESRWVITLSGGKCFEEQKRTLKAFNRAVCGRAKKFWYRRYDDPEWELVNELIGTGDGVRTDFQAGIHDDVPGLPGGVFKPVYGLDHDIPPLGVTVTGQVATKTRYIDVFLNGVKQAANTYTVFRETGLIRFTTPVPVGVKVTISGGFFAVVRLDQEYIETEPAGAGWYIVSNDVALIEPKGALGNNGGGGT